MLGNFADLLFYTATNDFMQQDAVILWSYDPSERDARLAKDALKAKRMDSKHLQVLVEIACASTPNHLISVRKAYCSLFDHTLEEDIEFCVSQPSLRKVIIHLNFYYSQQNHLANY